MVDPDQLWREKYAERHASVKEAEDRARCVAFLDTTFLVCGEELRPLTARDLLQLDMTGNTFVGYDAGLRKEAQNVQELIWLLHQDNPARSILPPTGLRARLKHWRIMRRINRLDSEQAFEEVREFMRTQLQDSPARCRPTKAESSSKPIGASFIASIVMRVALDTGWRENEIIDIPLSRVFQYIKLIDARALGSEYKDFSASDAIMSEYLDELNHA